MSDKNDKVYAIETNPRLGSSISVFLALDADKIVNGAIFKTIDKD